MRPSLAAMLVIACLAVPLAPSAQEDTNDPLEPVNRVIFGFNQVIDGLVLDPAQQLYGLIVPEPAKTGIRNVLDNLRAPIIFANDLLQGEPDRAGNTLARFLVNSTLGVGGIFDAAAGFGLPARHSEDFGQTLGVYGLGEGPYLVLPILGPSSLRDAAGLGVDGFLLSPWPYVVDQELILGARVVDGIDTRHRLDPAVDDLEANSLDLYAAYRSVYRQVRAAEIRNGEAPVDDTAYEDIFEEDF